ncbi:nucleoside hydrolase [Enterobacteriaceae bacterium LUAb1]
MKKIIIDCDPGNGIPGANTDDGLALALAIASPALSVELITTVSGNTPGETGYAVVKEMLTRLGLDIPLVRGASEAMVEPAISWRALLDNRVKENGLAVLWQDVIPPPAVPITAPLAAYAIGEQICNHPGEITLVAIGPLTNIAHAMQLYPQLAECVAEIVIMGGVFTLDSYVKDTNFGIDPEAAHKVLSSGANITLAPMDATTQTMMNHQDLDEIAALKTPLADFLVQTMRPWISYSMATRHLPGCWIHDALVISWLIHPQVASVDSWQVGIELNTGATRGKAWRYHSPLRLDIGIDTTANQTIQLLQTVDNALLLKIIKQTLSRYK